MQDQTVAYEIKPREEIVKKLKAAYKLKDGIVEDLQRKRVEFLTGFEALGNWHAEQGRVLLVNLGNNEIENPETNEENKLIANRYLLKAVALYNMAMASEDYAPRKDQEKSLQEIIASEQPTQPQLIATNQLCIPNGTNSYSSMKSNANSGFARTDIPDPSEQLLSFFDNKLCYICL